MSAFFCKILPFFCKINTFTQSNSVWAVIEIFSFCKIKDTFNGNVRFTGYRSRIRLPDGSKFAINRKNDNDVTIWRHDVMVKIFWRFFVSLVKFSYWSNFYVNIITGSGVMIIFFCKVLIRNLEFGNTCLSFCLISENWDK